MVVGAVVGAAVGATVGAGIVEAVVGAGDVGTAVVDDKFILDLSFTSIRLSLIEREFQRFT